MMGDSEMAEGSVWEAMETASFHGLNGLTAILDLNRLGQRGPDDARVERRRVPRPRGGVRLARDRDRRPRRRRRSTRRTPRRGAADRPTMIVARTEKGHGVSFTGERRGLAREGAVRRTGGRGDRRAGRRTEPDDHAAQARVVHPDRARHGDASAEAPVYDGPDRHAQGVRRRPARGSPAIVDRRSWCSTARSATPPTRTTFLDGRSRAILRGLHRGTDDGGRADRACRRSARSAFSATFGAFYTRADRLRADGSDRPRGPPALRLARGRVDRRGRPVADGARGPGDDARAAQLDRAVPGGRERDREARRPPCATCRASRTSAPRARRRRRSTARTRQFPIGGSKTLASGPDDRVTLVGAGVTLHGCMGAAETLAEGRASRRG